MLYLKKAVWHYTLIEPNYINSFCTIRQFFTSEVRKLYC